MLVQFVAFAALGAACAGCSAPAVQTALPTDNPANPAAASAPFVRPANVLAEGGMPSTGIPPIAQRMSGGAMAGMDMPAGPMASTGHGFVVDTGSGVPGSPQ